MPITLNNARVIAFYERTGLDPERINELLVDMLEDVFEKKSASEPEMLTALRELTTAQTAYNAGMTSMMETARAQTLADTVERGLQLSKASEHFVDRLAILLPKTQDEATRRIFDDISRDVQRQEPAILANMELKLVSHQQTIVQQFREEIGRAAQRQEPALLANLELKLVGHQQSLMQLLQTTREEQIGRRVAEDSLREQLGGFLQTMHSSHTRGQVSENQLETLLVELFPSAEIINNTGKTASGDFFMKREGKPDIMVENKTYGRNVDRVEVDKFVRDVLLNGRCSGLFLSQRTGIVGKHDFEIDIQDGHVFLFAHCVDMNSGRIRAAITIIDSLSARLTAIVEAEGESGIAIPRAVLDEINEQYRAFEKRRSEMLTTIKDNAKVMQAHIGAMEMPTLATYLSGSYLTERTDKCAVCGKIFAGARALSSHMRAHK